MTSPAWTLVSRVSRVWRICLAAAVVGSVAGCVGMPSGGPATEFTASPQSTQQENNFSGPYASGPEPNGSPRQIVEGFLAASGSDPAYSAVAGEYLLGSAARNWNPGSVKVLGSVTVTDSGQMAPHGASRASVSVTGPVQAAFSGSDRYISAQAPSQATVGWKFVLVKAGGQWRISNPPPYRILNENDFPSYYRAQDLYFVAPSDQALVPDPVFVPLGATEEQLVTDLVDALADNPATPWLAGAADSEFPPKTTVAVTVDGATATVNLGGAAAKAGTGTLELISAQLVWTLTGSPANPSGIQSVVLEIDGRPFTPLASPCPGGRVQGSFQTQATYECDNPYLSASASFYYVNQGQSWSRCGSEAYALKGSIGSVLPVIGRTGSFTSPQCATGRYVSEAFPGPPPVQPSSLRPVSMSAVSPDGRYLAIVTPGKDALYIGRLSGDATSFPGTTRLSGSGITALGWDRSDNLWVAQNGSISMLRATGTSTESATFNQGNVAQGNAAALSVAPDGVRMAVIVTGNGPGRELEVAAINQNGQQQAGLLGVPHVRPQITGVPLGASLADPVALTWYGADDLIVLNHTSAGNALWEVPVDGQTATALQITPPGTISITADGPANVLVAGLSDNLLAVSPGLEGPWQTLGEQGHDPAYSG